MYKHKLEHIEPMAKNFMELMKVLGAKDLNKEKTSKIMEDMHAMFNDEGKYHIEEIIVANQLMVSWLINHTQVNNERFNIEETSRLTRNLMVKFLVDCKEGIDKRSEDGDSMFN